MEKIVFDSCSLIYITKISLKNLIMSNFSKKLIPKTVKREVLRDFEKYTEAKLIKNNIDSQKISENEINIKKFIKNLGLGESEAISLAEKENSLLITDDKIALNLALNRGIQAKTTEVLLLFLLKKSQLDYNTFLEKLNALNKIKILKPEIFQMIIQEAEKYK